MPPFLVPRQGHSNLRSSTWSSPALEAVLNGHAAGVYTCVTAAQISVDFAWSPHGIDGRHFDWMGLAAAADLLFVMAYDMQSQVRMTQGVDII